MSWPLFVCALVLSCIAAAADAPMRTGAFRVPAEISLLPVSQG
jgi:hypothetical protein